MKNVYKCTFEGCDKTYANISILHRHFEAFHSSSNKFQCKTCGKALASLQNLNEHYFIHTGEKPYRCKQTGCGMTFRQGTHLSAHKKMHQKKDFSNAFIVLCEGINKLWKQTEENTENQEIRLPKIEETKGKTSLPSLFD